MQVDKNLISFDQFSHDLTLALEETRCGANGRWGMRRRTRSTGNLPCPPQPTEDSSSSPTDPPNDNNNNEGAAGHSNSIQSDSDDRHSFAFKLRQQPMPLSGNFESDSLNENFSPSRPNIRRKRKFKRMAVEYETTPSTPHTATHPIFPISGTVKKRVLKHTCQENFRANLFFCGKRKRPHRERYTDYESHKHSSSVPRQRSNFLAQKDGGLSYLEYKSRNRASSMSTTKPMEKIMPLNKSIVSKIEKIAQKTQNHRINFNFTTLPSFGCEQVDSSVPVVHFHSQLSAYAMKPQMATADVTTTTIADENKANLQKMAQKSGSFESALPKSDQQHKKKVKNYHGGLAMITGGKSSKHSRRRELQLHKMQLQFDDQHFMDCGNLNDFLSSSSLSSSDSEAEQTNESDHEGDDELTDWPANEVMINFASKNEFKRANKVRLGSKLPQIKQQDDIIQDDDTLMSADEIGSSGGVAEEEFQATPQPPNTLDLGFKYAPELSSNQKIQSSNPINIINSILPDGCGGSNTSGVVGDGGYGSCYTASYNCKQPIESEMSGETSNHFLSSPNTFGEVREIRAGCRRIREERPGFSIITSFNEDLLKFLQDEQQKQLKIFDIQEYDKILELAKLYSLNIQTENGCIILNKTSNTMQAVKVSKEQNNLTKYFFSDYKRRCVGGDTE
ncbi:unnamed protein product [Diamesa hyperborea]